MESLVHVQATLIYCFFPSRLCLDLSENEFEGSILNTKFIPGPVYDEGGIFFP